MSKDILIVALTGMPGAGKTTVANFLSHKGIALLVMGDVVREAAETNGLAPTSHNLTKLMLNLRKKNGPGARSPSKRKTPPKKLRDRLKPPEPPVERPADLMQRAFAPIERMLALK